MDRGAEERGAMCVLPIETLRENVSAHGYIYHSVFLSLSLLTP